MSTQITIKPATADLKIRLPDRPMEYLPAEGAAVEKNTFWLRRLRDGSVIETKPAKTKTTKE